MSPDRYGETPEPHSCRNGWLTPDDSDAPRLCPICRPQRRHEIHDTSTQFVSDRARAAIEQENRNA